MIESQKSEREKLKRLGINRSVTKGKENSQLIQCENRKKLSGLCISHSLDFYYQLLLNSLPF